MKDVAIATYLDNNENLIKEFDWLYKSWLYSSSWRNSQIVVFHHHKVKISYPEVIAIPLEPLTERDSDWKEYPFINSVEYLTRPEAAILADYKYVLRTDNDCFLTPYFSDFQPRLATFGIGMYSVDHMVAVKLIEIAARWGITPYFNNVGSTLFSTPNHVLSYSQIQFEYCKKLRTDEFKDGYGQWPGWYFGVLTMYAGQLAANSYFGLNMTLGGLDVHCMSHDKISPSDYHIHAWHTYDDFSKFKWREGKYSRIDRSLLDPSVIADYCLFIAGNTP